MMSNADIEVIENIEDIKVYQQAQGLLSVQLSPNKISNWNIRNKNGKWYLYRNARHRNGYKSFDVNLAPIIHNPSELNKAIYELIVIDGYIEEHPDE